MGGGVALAADGVGAALVRGITPVFTRATAPTAMTTVMMSKIKIFFIRVLLLMLMSVKGVFGAGEIARASPEVNQPA
jgi:hypothetical protein